MAAPKCSPPKAQSVRSYWRSGPRRKPKPPATYWECERHGKGCGTKHRTYSAALGHANRLDKSARREARARGTKLALWQPRKHEGKVRA